MDDMVEKVARATICFFVMCGVAASQEIAGVDWINIGITTGKFSESISSSVFKTKTECEAYSPSEDHTCFPIPALPPAYWEALDAASAAYCREQPDDNARCLELGLMTDGKYIETLSGEEREVFQRRMERRRAKRLLVDGMLEEYDACNKETQAHSQLGLLSRALTAHPHPKGCIHLAPWRRLSEINAALGSKEE